VPLALGIDIGNAKLKACVAHHADAAKPRWLSRPLPYNDRSRYSRHADFEAGVPAVLGELLGAEQPDVRAVVIVSSSGYAYPTYAEGVIHSTALVAQLFPNAACFALGHDGVPVSATEVARHDPAVLGRLTFTNGMGAAHLARRLDFLGTPACGLVVDTGGTTSQVASIVDGAIEPATADGTRYLEHRLRNGKAVWIGTQTTPLECLATEVPVGFRMFPVLPRGVMFDSVAAALELGNPVLAKKLHLFGLAPTRNEALRAIADSVNLDADLASEADLVALAEHYLALARQRLESELSRALGTMPPHARRRALVFGLGASWLTIPALNAAGVDETAEASRWLGPELADIASCYGACHLALEHLAERTLPAVLP